jgi:hypothetical protein
LRCDQNEETLLISWRYIYETLYTVAITLCKFSILLFYSRIFKEKKFKIALWITASVVIAWFLAIEISVILTCRPVSALWVLTEDGTCINFTMFFVGSGTPNVILNFIILVLPLPSIWALDIERKHKVALSSVFLLGGFVVIVSIVRVAILGNLNLVDLTWNYVDAALWTSVEPAVAVVSASLPILRSLFIWRRKTSSLQKSSVKASMASGHHGHNAAASHHRRGGNESNGRIGSFTSSHPLNELSADNEPWGRAEDRQGPKSEKGAAMVDMSMRKDLSSTTEEEEEEEGIALQDLQMREVRNQHQGVSTERKGRHPSVAELYG